jgi:hypothetical protein
MISWRFSILMTMILALVATGITGTCEATAGEQAPAGPAVGVLFSPSPGGGDSFFVTLEKSEGLEFGDFFIVRRNREYLGTAYLVSMPGAPLVVSILSSTVPARVGDRVEFLRHRKKPSLAETSAIPFLQIFKPSPLYQTMLVCRHCGTAINRGFLERFSGSRFYARCNGVSHEILTDESLPDSHWRTVDRPSLPLYSTFTQPYISEMTTNTNFLNWEDFPTVDDFPNTKDIPTFHPHGFNEPFNEWNRKSAFTNDILATPRNQAPTESGSTAAPPVQPPAPLFGSPQAFLNVPRGVIESLDQVNQFPDGEGYDRNNKPVQFTVKKITITQVTRTPVMAAPRPVDTRNLFMRHPSASYMADVIVKSQQASYRANNMNPQQEKYVVKTRVLPCVVIMKINVP